jgi:HSP20 family protein
MTTATANPPAETTRKNAPVFAPHVDIVERAGELVLLADMPGVSGEAIDIEFKDGTLTVRGHVCPREQDGRRYLLREYGVGDFYRTFQVSESVNAEKITAAYRDGVLELHLPKVAPPEPRKINVKVGG